MLANLENNWSLVYHMVEQTLAITEKQSSYINEPYCWDSTIYDLCTISCYKLEMLSKACEFAKIAAEMSPEDKRLQRIYKIIKQKMSST